MAYIKKTLNVWSYSNNVVFYYNLYAKLSLKALSMFMQPKSVPNNQNDTANGIGGFQQSEQMFRLLVESVGDYAIFMVSPDGIIETWNKGAEKIKGYTSAEIIGKHISVFYTREDIERNVPALSLKRAAANGSYECESLRIRKDGSLFLADVVFTALYDDLGGLNGFAEVTRDITERKSSESKLAYLGKLIEKTSDAIFSYNSSYTLLSWNKAAENMYGYKAGDVLRKNVMQLLGTEANKEARKKIIEHLEEKKGWTGEVVHKRRDGTVLPVFISVSVVNGTWDEPEEYVCVCRDISEKKEPEKKAAAMQAEIDRLLLEKLDTTQKEIADYKYALDKSSIVAVTDHEGIIKYVNDNFCAISGYAREELLGQDHRIINSGYHPQDFIRNLWVTIANGGVWKGEIKNRAKNGVYYWVDTTIVPFLNENGKPYQYVAIRADITERKRAEEELNLLNEQLEVRVKSRTHDLQIANSELESFSYSVSHDLRAPLRAVSGFARILEEDYGHLLDGEGTRVLNKIISSAGSMGRLIDDLLSFSRTGRKEIVGGTVNMKALADGCLAELAAGGGYNNYPVEIKPMPDCMGDVNLLKQVWVNLLDNAIKYSSKSEKPVITAGGNEDERGQCYFVKDNGVGFDMQYANKLFGVFQRLHSAEEFTGTGVGLALVRLVISKHHGEIWADATPGKGATFYFRLPKKVLS